MRADSTEPMRSSNPSTALREETKPPARSWLAGLRTFSAPHGRTLLWGSLATIGLAVFRVALPWPLRGVLEVAFDPSSGGSSPVQNSLPLVGEPLVMLCLTYAVMAVAAGAFEFFQRVEMSRFAALLTHDLRESVIQSVTGRATTVREQTPNEWVVRITSDSSSLRSGLSGILVQVSKNLLLFGGICSLLIWISPTLGIIFLFAGALVILIGMRSAARVAELTEKNREKAVATGDKMFRHFERGSARFTKGWSSKERVGKEVRTVREIALAMFLSSAALGVLVAIAVWLGVLQVQAGQLAAGELFLFIAYAITVHRRLVQIGRQIARSGKMKVSAERLLELLPDDREISLPSPKLTPLTEAIDLRDIVVKSPHLGKRIAIDSLSLHPGEAILVRGKPGSGKSTLLKVIAGALTPARGTVLWDGAQYPNTSQAAPVDDASDLDPQIGFLDEVPSFGRQKLSNLLGPKPASVEQKRERDRLFERLGVDVTLRKFRNGIKEKLSSEDLSITEARQFALACVMTSEASVWILDDPFARLGRARAEEQLAEVLAQAKEMRRLVLIATSQKLDLGPFDRVLDLKRGRCVLDQRPDEIEGDPPCKD